MHRLLRLLLLFAFAGCDSRTSNQVILATDDGTKHLIYDCSNFRPQVETSEQLQILAQTTGRTIRHASEHKRVVSAQAMMDAFRARDWRRLEQLSIDASIEPSFGSSFEIAYDRDA